MGGRARKRRKRARRPRTAPPKPRESPAERPARRRQGEAAERPRAPWGSFPLSELAILVGAVLLVLGFFVLSGPRQVTFIVTGFAIASLGAFEVALREHLAGYRSHSLLLAGVPAVIALGILFYAGPEGWSPAVRLLIGAAVYALAAWGLIEVFRTRSGGRAFRVRAPRHRR